MQHSGQRITNSLSLILILVLLIGPLKIFSKDKIVLPTPKPHPRLLMGEEIDDVKAYIAKNNQIYRIHNQILKECDKLISYPPLKREMKGIRLLDVSREALKRILYLSYAYRMTKEKKYAEKAISEMNNVCDFIDWNPAHFLDVAEMTVGVSIGYDWLYELLDSKMRSKIASAIKEKGLIPSFEPKYSKFLNRTNNWNSVCNAGVIYGAITIMDEFPDLSSEIISRSISSNFLALDSFTPDGGYPEGYNYWNYGTSFQVLLIDALDCAFGSDFGLSSSTSGFLKTPYWMEYMSSPTNKCFNFSDSPENTFCNIPMWWFANKTGDSSLVYIENQQLKNKSNTLLNSRLLPFLPIFAARLGEVGIKPPKGNTWYSRGTSPVYIYRGGWDQKTDPYLAIKGGSASTSHAHMDAGSFVYEYDGIRWAMDLGMQSYHSLESKNISLWDNKQDGQRWDILRMQNDYHNTLTVDNAKHNVKAKAEIVNAYNEPMRKGAIVNLTSTLGQVKKAHREVYLDSFDYLHVIDSISTNDKNLELMWVMVTSANPQLIDDNHILLDKDGKQMILSFSTNLDVKSHIWENTPIHDYDAPNPGTIRVGYTTTLTRNGNHRIECTLTPYNL